MSKTKAKIIAIIVLTIGIFYISLLFYEPILQFMIAPVSEMIVKDPSKPYIATASLGANFGIAWEIALYISIIFVMMVAYRRVAISFIFGGVFAYICILCGFFNIWNNGTAFSMEKYVNHLLIFMLFTGIILSLVLHQLAGNNNDK